MILLWGISADAPLACVREELSRRGAPALFLDQQAILETEIDLTVDDQVRGTLRLPQCELALTDIRAVYVRPYETGRMAAVVDRDPAGAERAHAFACDAALASWTELTSAFVINRLSAMASNASKPYQSLLIRAAGFEVPDTLVTTDRAALAAFRQKHREVIYKSISGVRSIVSRLTAEHSDRLGDIVTCPTQFQEYVDGTDVRVHVVGDETFGCEIESSADDYRYAHHGGLAAQLRPLQLPPEVAKGCHRLAKQLGLPVAGIDLRRRADGRWCCFEVNPSPAFTYYEHATGQLIGRAIANLLMTPPTSGNPADRSNHHLPCH
jgi:glutathione synthase/RimK-type ligase-like ATP-grasp enzyme